MAASPDRTSSAPAPPAGRSEPYEAAFRRIVGRLPNEAERARFHAVRSELRLRDDDALWALFVALEHYHALYERFPAMIRAAAGELLVECKTGTDRARAGAEQHLWNAAREQASATRLEVARAGEEAKARLERAIQQAARRIAREAGLAARWPWVFGGAAGMALVLALTGAVALGFGRQQGYHQGYHLGFVEGQRTATAPAPERPSDRPPSPPARGR